MGRIRGPNGQCGCLLINMEVRVPPQATGARAAPKEAFDQAESLSINSLQIRLCLCHPERSLARLLPSLGIL